MPLPFATMGLGVGRMGAARTKGGGGANYLAPSTVIATGEDPRGSAGGWAVGGGTLALETSNVRVAGRNVLKCLTNAGAAGQFMTVRHKFSTKTLSGNLEFWFYLPTISAGTRYMQICYSSDTPAADPPTATPTNRRRISYNSDQFPSSGWHCVQIHKDGKFYSAGTPGGVAWADTGSPDATKLEFIEIVYGCDSSVPDAERYFLLDQVAINGKGRPAIILGFDGGYASHVNTALPLFQARNLLGYNAIDGDTAAASRSYLSPLYDAGWDIISQGIAHTNYSSNPGNLAADIPAAQAYLTAEGYLRGQSIFMYPNNARSAANGTTAASAGIRLGVASPQQLMPASSLGKPSFVGQGGRLGAEGVGITFSGRWKAWVDEAVLSGKSLMLYSHDLVASASSSTETTISEYTALLDYIAGLRDAGTVRVMTPSQYLATYG